MMRLDGRQEIRALGYTSVTNGPLASTANCVDESQVTSTGEVYSVVRQSAVTVAPSEADSETTPRMLPGSVRKIASYRVQGSSGNHPSRLLRLCHTLYSIKPQYVRSV